MCNKSIFVPAGYLEAEKHTMNNRNTRVPRKEMSSTQSYKDNHNNNSTQNGNRRSSLAVNNFPENQTAFKPMKPGPQFYSKAVKSKKKIELFVTVCRKQ